MNLPSNLIAYLQKKYHELVNEDTQVYVENFVGFYKQIEDKNLKYLFAYFHYKLNSLFQFMNYKKGSNGHYNADASRELFNLIQTIDAILGALKEYGFGYELHNSYAERMQYCEAFLSLSGGSAIPEDYTFFKIFEIEPIFVSLSTVKVREKVFERKSLGEGSYAKVYYYKDDFYNKKFAIKVAKNNLDEKELKRFRQEFETMKKLSSPYILEVYNYNETENSYVMEFANYSLYDYILQNNANLTIPDRKKLVNQIFKAFGYLHSKEGLHRDISSSNILLRIYDDETIVVKLSDFGLVKLKESNLTTDNTEFKGSLNDPELDIVGGFKNYNIIHETYALTRLIYFVMTGKSRIEKILNAKFQNFVDRGISKSHDERYKSILEIQKEFSVIDF